MPTLILLRHGESKWNAENRFTGWTDVDLSFRGLEEAKAAGRWLLKEGLGYDVAFTSVLTRAIRTLWVVMEQTGRMWVPVHRTWRLNERHYGALQGLNKTETARKYGDDQVALWRRSYDVAPPPLGPNDPRHPKFYPRYAQFQPGELPVGESLKDTLARVMPCWTDQIEPELQDGKQVIVAAHGNSLRALVKHLDRVSDKDIPAVEIPTGRPIVYELDDELEVTAKYQAEDL